jgi:hypothetical protein
LKVGKPFTPFHFCHGEMLNLPYQAHNNLTIGKNRTNVTNSLLAVKQIGPLHFNGIALGLTLRSPAHRRLKIHPMNLKEGAGATASSSLPSPVLA